MNRQSSFPIETRKIPIPPHRGSPCKRAWTQIYPPLVEHLHLQVRFNVKSKAAELRHSVETQDAEALQKGADFIQAIAYVFDIEDAIALLRLDNLYSKFGQCYLPFASIQHADH